MATIACLNMKPPPVQIFQPPVKPRMQQMVHMEYVLNMYDSACNRMTWMLAVVTPVNGAVAFADGGSVTAADATTDAGGEGRQRITATVLSAASAGKARR